MDTHKKIGFLGPEGTFTEIATKTLFQEEERTPFATIRACLEAVENGEVDYGVVPLENTIEGSVNMTLDLLSQQVSLPIVGELVLPIRQHLLIHPDQSDWKRVKRVLSHPHAIAQCHIFLQKELPEAELSNAASTSAAAEYVQNEGNLEQAAIGNELAAEKYGLTIAKSNIHDTEDNDTRFLVLHRTPKALPRTPLFREDRVTYKIILPSDYPGALHQVLAAFAWRNLNLTKIESRPMKTGLGNYFFIIDVERPNRDILLKGVMEEIQALGIGISVLGEYPCFVVNGQN
ncbi:prephenate dehydratase [Guptibacillus hwajinpoensis]|uniref:Prephenate dehydratase n=1 Tax=Guptibacillus hwajinpoensis TaxID=208199 RepID=A0A0J6CMT1_9BACL|nr:prephenate dehydratase [Alkalihalobacillus macyae]KMM37526.1 prephenate dehydratase [Alkalihalobacillus macyae]